MWQKEQDNRHIGNEGGNKEKTKNNTKGFDNELKHEKRHGITGNNRINWESTRKNEKGRDGTRKGGTKREIVNQN